MKFNFIFFLKSILATCIAFMMPIHTLIIGVGALILLDTIAGLYRAFKLKQSITSKKFGHIISKILLYNIAIISGYILQWIIGIDVLPISKLIASVIGLTEIKSILENVNEITGIDLWKFVMNYVKRSPDEMMKTISEVDTHKTQP